ncbi:putative C2H2-type domain-containing protein [Seiridium cardinale]|uniref:C2H2-type domain-containing protein n=1 Tax=Seiridium cardinale TaxID=138064 RepID=A0ABR2XTE1_9PEZI
MIGEDQYQTLVKSASSVAPSGINRCPLCNETGTADSEQLLDHIAQHMHGFSLSSLPWPKDPDPEKKWQEDEYFAENDYFNEVSGDYSQRSGASARSDRDSYGLASLPSNGSIQHPSDSDIRSDSTAAFSWTGTTARTDGRWAEIDCPDSQVLEGPTTIIHTPHYCLLTWTFDYAPFNTGPFLSRYSPIPTLIRDSKPVRNLDSNDDARPERGRVTRRSFAKLVEGLGRPGD